jgi:hypothetical protein
MAVMSCTLLTPILLLASGPSAANNLAPRTVTLRVDDIPLSKAVAELAKQTGYAVERKTAKDPPLNLDLRQATFWQALDAVAERAGARVALYRGDGRLALVDGKAQKHVSHDGLFRTAVQRLVAVNDYETGTRHYTASLEVAWEPRLRPFLLETRPRSFLVDGERPAEDGGSGQVAVDGKAAAVIDLRLQARPRSVDRLQSLKGELSLIAATKLLTFTFDSLGGNAPLQQTQEGVTVRLAKMTLQQERWTAQVELEYPPGGPHFESFQSWVVNNEIYLKQKGSGQRFPNNRGSATLKRTNNRAVLLYHFVDEPDKKLIRGKPEEWELVYHTPARIIEVPIRFEFKDLLLP